MADSICQNEHLKFTKFTKSNDFEASCTPKAWLNRNKKQLLIHHHQWYNGFRRLKVGFLHISCQIPISPVQPLWQQLSIQILLTWQRYCYYPIRRPIMHLFIIRTTRSDVLRRKDHSPASSAIAVARTAKMAFNIAEMTPTMLCRQGERFDCKKAGRPTQQLKKIPLKKLQMEQLHRFTGWIVQVQHATVDSDC